MELSWMFLALKEEYLMLDQKQKYRHKKTKKIAIGIPASSKQGIKIQECKRMPKKLAI